MARTRSDDRPGFTEADPAASARDLDALIAWLGSNRIRTAGTRLETYQRHLYGWLNAVDQGEAALTQFQRREGHDHVANSIFEGSEWCSIYRAFCDEEADKELRSVLRKAVGPPVHYNEEEGGKTNARDHQFELSFGARLKHAGFPIEFGAGSDLRFPIREKTVFVECKRVQTEANIPKRVHKAQRKLHACYESCASGCWGFVALSVTKAIDPTQERSFCDTWPDLRDRLRAQAEVIATDHQEVWVATKDSRTIGAAVEFRSMAWVKAGGPFLCSSGEVYWHGVGSDADLKELGWWEMIRRFDDGLS